MKKALLAPDGRTGLRQYLGYQGAGSGFGGQLRNWDAPEQSADAALLPTLDRGNARADDLIRNNGVIANVLNLHKDHIVGNQFRLSYKPNWRVLGLDRDPEFIKDVEAAFVDIAEDPRCWIDAERKRTFTQLIRDMVGMHFSAGEVMAKPEWLSRPGTPYRTAIKLVSPRRVYNPGRASDTDRLRAGIELTRSGAAQAVHIAEGDSRYGRIAESRRVSMWLSNGRPGFIHVFEPSEPDQTRGANQLLSVMERVKMLDTLQNTKLQSVILAAMYAATIESELGSAEAMEFMLGTGSRQNGALEDMLTGFGDYYAENNVKMNGVRVPHLMPGDKLNLQAPPHADSGFSALESSLFRYISAGTGFSYEQITHDWSQVNYSSGRAGTNEAWRFTLGRRRLIANRCASLVFELLFEEMLARRIITLPRRARLGFEEARHAWTRCDWIGAGRMAMDGLKEIKESILLIEAGLSTYEKEAAKMGEDYQEMFEQQVREMEERRSAGLPPPSWVKALMLAPDQVEPEQESSRGRMNANLAHIAAAAFNRPVLLEPGYARLFYATLAGRYGLDAVINVQGEAESVASLQREAAGYGRASRADDRPYQVINGIALLPVSGTLVHKFGFINPASGMTGYDGIQNRLAQAVGDPEVRGILMDYDTPGGTVAGAFDTADLIQRYSKIKPIWSLSYDMNASAGQLLAAAGNRRLVTQTGQAGSVGVLVAHTNIEKMLAEKGAEITLVYSGAHKVDANPYQKLPTDVRERLQAEVDDTRQRFASKVADFTGMSLDAVLATEARLYEGQAAVEVGLADEVVNGADAVGLMSDYLNRQSTGTKIYTPGASTMKNEGQDSNTEAAVTQPPTTEPTAAQVAELSQSAATAERERVLGILGCEEAQGRQDLAHKLVAKGMGLEDAKDVLSSAPIAATDRTGQTALDTLAGQEHGAGLEAGADSDQNTDAAAGLSAAVTTVAARG